MDNQSNYNNGNNGYGGGGYGSGGPGNNRSNGNNNNNGNNGDNNNKNNKNGQMIMVFILVSLVALFIMSMVMNRYTSMSTSEISYSDFLQMVEDGKVESVEFDSYQINIHRFLKTRIHIFRNRLIIVDVWMIRICFLY